MKICTKCGIEKSIGEFSKRSNRKLGHVSRCKPCMNAYNKELYQSTKEEKLAYGKEYRQKNKIKKSVYLKKYYQVHKKEILVRELNRRKVDVQCRLGCLLRSRINDVLRGKSKSLSTMKLLGCSLEYLKVYFESKFQDGMTWENRGRWGWHIDHLTPCVSFDLTKPEEQRQCFHYTNLQPLWAKDNLIKGSKIIIGQKDRIFA